MSSIAERIKLKLEVMEKYNSDEQADRESNYSDAGEESVFEIELLNLENLEKDSSLAQNDKEEMFQKYLSEKDSLNNKNQNSFEVEKMNIKKHRYCKYNNDKYYNGQIDEKSLKYLNKKDEEAAYSNQASEKKFKLQSNQFKSYSNCHSNYSTDFTKNFESNKKSRNYNYCELEDFAKENIFNCEGEEYLEKSDTYFSIDNSKCESSFDQKTFENLSSVSSKRNSESKASENQMNLMEILNYESNDNPCFHYQNNPQKTFCKNTNEDVKSNKISDEENFFYNRISDENNSDALKTTVQSKNSEESEPRRFFVFFSFIEELLFVFMMIFLLILDPIIILILKIFDWIIKKINKINGSNKYFLIDKSKTNNNFCNHLLICGEIEEVDAKNHFDNFENPKIFFSLYEKYFDYFFNNCGYKKLSKTIKICFISISVFLNLIIMMSLVEKNSKILLFFLNNLYLLYHTMDIYNESLLSYSESVRWSNILEKI